MPFARESTHRAIVAALLWIWIGTVLLSLQHVAYMGDTRPVTLYIGILLFSQFVPRAWVRRTLLVIVVLTLVKWQYYPFVPWSDPSLFVRDLASDAMLAIRSLWSSNFAYVNDGIRTLAFFGIITFGVKLLEEFALRPLWFVAAIAMAEYALIDVAALYKVQDHIAVILCFAVGFLLLAILHLPRLRVLSLSSRRDIARHLALPFAFLSVTALVGAAVPDVPVHWPAARPFFSLWFHRTRSTQGGQPYGSHSDALGGPFRGSNKVFLRVFANASSYYRGAVLQNYTGRGWVAGPSAPLLSYASGSGIAPSILEQTGLPAATPTRLIRQRIVVEYGQYPVLFGAYESTRVSGTLPNGGYLVNGLTGALSPTAAVGPGVTYDVVSKAPNISSAQLARVHDGNLAYAFPNDLQLPVNLPERDVELARRITGGVQGTYAKVQAIIHYLQTHETYATSNIPFVKPGQDFVDQFLFVSHRGYCDQFSSALAVLSRAVGIPSRWVEGFVSVPADPNYHGPGKEYVLRGVDAHSWVEIWFAGYGWVPMEATPSFVLPSAQARNAVHTAPTASVQEKRPKVLSPVKSPKSALAHARHPGTTTRYNLGWAALAFAVVALVTIWGARLVRARKRRGRGDEFEDRMRRSLTRLTKRFGKRPAGQTLREYAAMVGEESGGSELRRFVEWYERARYSARSGTGLWGEGASLLKDIARSERFRKNGNKRRPRRRVHYAEVHSRQDGL